MKEYDEWISLNVKIYSSGILQLSNEELGIATSIDLDTITKIDTKEDEDEPYHHNIRLFSSKGVTELTSESIHERDAWHELIRDLCPGL